MDSGESIGASSSRQLAKAAREEAQPFFTARIYAPDADREALQALRLSVQGQLRDFLATPRPQGAQGYIFYRSEPVVTVSKGAVQISLATGGATEDEFLLLHFLRLQQRPSGLLRQCAIQVVDEDGQFLLIEAADHIPDWISPDNADGRVWLYQEDVKILPLETPADLTSSLQALNSHTPASSRPLNDAAFSRMSTYPSTQWTEALQHRTAVILPSLNVAKALQARPQLIARAGQAFLGRDARDARLASKMTKFLTHADGSTASSSGPVAIIITLPRRLYTHLLSARFHPPKIFPTPYQAHVTAFWTALDSLTTPEGAANDSEETRQRRAATLQESRRWDLGCKLAVGLEIAFANDSERNRRRRRHDVFAARPAQSDSARDHEKFLSRLESFGYFEGEMRGSKRWKELEAKAVEEWGREPLPRASSSAVSKDNEADEDDEAHTAWTQDSSLFNASSSSAPLDTIPPSDLAALSAQEQDDSWLYEVGDTFLNDNSGGATTEEEQAQQKLSEFAAQMERFVEGKGDVEGALIDEDDSDEEDSEDEEGAKGSARERLAKMTDEEKAEHLQKLLPGLKDRVEWSGPSGDEGRDRMEEDLRAVLEESQHTDPPAASASASTPTPSTTRKPTSSTASQRPLNKDELRRSFASSAKALRSGTGNIEGGKSWGLEADSDDDDAEVDEDGNALPQLDENGEPETKETRRQRALMLGLDPSDDEDDDGGKDEGDKGAKSVPSLEEDVADEMDEFVDFASKELGLSKKQLDGIMAQRRSEGRWVPGKEQAKEREAEGQPASTSSAGATPAKPATAAPASSLSAFGKGFGKGFLNKKAATPGAAAKPAAAAATPQASSLKKHSDAGTDGISSTRDDKPTKRVAFSSDTTGSDKDVPTPTAPGPAAAPSQPTTSSPFSAFDALLSALDTRLNEHRASKGLPPLTEAELQNAPVRGEDWNLRRPGGASLGSVMAKEAKDQKEKGGQAATVGETATAVPTETQPQPQPGSADAMEDVQPEVGSAAAAEDDDEDEEMLPLSAKDPALLERCLAEQDAQPPSFKEMVAQLDEERAARRAQGQQQQQQTSANHPGAARIVELPTCSSEPISKPSTATPSEMPGLEDSDEESVESAESDEEMFPTIVADGAEEGEGGAMADLLESWRAQGGRPGPVGNLVGGMGLRGQAPR